MKEVRWLNDFLVPIFINHHYSCMLLFSIHIRGPDFKITEFTVLHIVKGGSALRTSLFENGRHFVP